MFHLPRIFFGLIGVIACTNVYSSPFKNSDDALKWLHSNQKRWVSQPPEFRKRFNDDYEKFVATLQKYVKGEISDDPMGLTLDEQNAIKQRCKNKCGVEKCGYNASFKEYKETAGETVCYESSQSANRTPPKSEPKSRKLSEEDCKKTCQGTNKKCETSNEVGWYCIDLADGEYEKEDDCTTACTDGKCEYTRITNKAKIPYHAFVCKSKEQEELKAKIEPVYVYAYQDYTATSLDDVGTKVGKYCKQNNITLKTCQKPDTSRHWQICHDEKEIKYVFQFRKINEKVKQETGTVIKVDGKYTESAALGWIDNYMKEHKIDANVKEDCLAEPKQNKIHCEDKNLTDYEFTFTELLTDEEYCNTVSDKEDDPFCKSKEQTAEQEELKAKIEPYANRIIEAYNTRKAALEAENSK